MNFLEIHREVLLYILSFLKTYSLRQVSLVCQYLCKVSETEFKRRCGLLCASFDEGSKIIWKVEYENLLDLGRFEELNLSCYKGIEVKNNGNFLRKLKNTPDSNNVFVRKRIKFGKFFASFYINQSRDEMVIGVSPNPENARKLNGWDNISSNQIWCYSRKSENFGMVYFAQKKIVGKNTFSELDMVTIYVDADAREVRWYKNGKFVAKNLPHFPLPTTETGYGIFVLLDDVGDEVTLKDFGYDKVPFIEEIEDLKVWDETIEKCGLLT